MIGKSHEISCDWYLSIGYSRKTMQKWVNIEALIKKIKMSGCNFIYYFLAIDTYLS